MPGKTDRQKKIIIERFDPGTKDGTLKKNEKEKKKQRAHS